MQKFEFGEKVNVRFYDGTLREYYYMGEYDHPTTPSVRLNPIDEGNSEWHKGHWAWTYLKDISKIVQPEQLKGQPVKIQMDKQYRTRDGREVRVLCVDRNSKHPVIALTNNVGINSYTETGEYYAGGTSVHDLIEYNPAQDLKLDQPIWVRNSPTTSWHPRHFAEVSEGGSVKCWDHGGTSHTCKQWDTSHWDYWTATKPE